jgi:HK97 family phage prohead protease
MTTAIIVGYGLVWEDWAEVDGHLEQFRPGAFQNASARLTCDHDKRPGAVVAWACPVIQDEVGLRFRAVLDLERRRDVAHLAALIRAGVLSQCSFTFRPIASSREGDIEVIERARLLELAITSSPFYGAGGAWVEGDCLDRAPARVRALAAAYGRVPTIVPVRAKPPLRLATTPPVSRRRPTKPKTLMGIGASASPLRQAVARHINAYLRRCPAWLSS